MRTDSALIHRFARPALAGSMLVMGACGIIYEYALGTLGNNLMGTSHEQIYVIIGLMMFAMGIGASSQRFLTRHLLDTFLLVEITLGLMGGLSVVLVYGAYAYLSSYQLLLYLIAGTIGFLIGLEIPLLIRINKAYEDRLSINLGNILSMDYVGSLIGALLFAFVFVSWLGLERIALVLGLCNLAVAFLGAFIFRPLLEAPRLITSALVVALILLALGYAQAPAWMADFEQRTYQDPIVHRMTSPYQHIVLTRRQERLRMYLNGQLQFDTTDEERYHEMLVHMPMSLAPRSERVLILGGGDGLALREVLRYPQVAEVDLVDLDPAITRLAAEYPDLVAANQGSLHDARLTRLSAAGISPGEPLSVMRASTLKRSGWDDTIYRTASVRVLNIDADQFLRQIAGLGAQPYDIVLIDFPDPHSLELCKLYSLDFYRVLRRIVHHKSLISCQSGSPVQAKKVFDCIGATLAAADFEVLPYHHAVPSFGHWGWHLARLAGARHSLATELAALRELRVSTRHVTADLLRASSIFGRDEQPDPTIAINTRFRPVILRYFRQSWRNS